MTEVGEKFIGPPNKTNFLNHPLLDYVADVKEYEVSPKLPADPPIRRFKRVKLNIPIYEPKSRRVKNVKVEDEYEDVKPFKEKKAEGLIDFYDRFGIKPRKLKLDENPNYYQFNLKNQNDSTFMITNWRKQLGLKNTPLENKINNAVTDKDLKGVNTKSGFMDLFNRVKKSEGETKVEPQKTEEKKKLKSLRLI